MSHFYASIKGNRGEATRGGSKESGITGHVRGWNIGVEIDCHNINGEDQCIIAVTGGSKSPAHRRVIATAYQDGLIDIHPHNKK